MFYRRPAGVASFLPCRHDREDLLFVVALVVLASAAAEDVALGPPLRGGIFPDVVLQSPVDEGDAAAVILLSVLKWHGAKSHEFTDLLKTHFLSAFL